MSARASSPLVTRGRQIPEVRAALEHALREAACWAMTRLPLFRWRRTAPGATTGPPIIFAHGYGQTCDSFGALAHALTTRGRGPMFAYEYSSLGDIGSSADGLGQFIEAVRYATGAPTVDLIAHSMGGLVVVEHLRRAGRESYVRRCITLASPHGGIRWPGPVPGRAAPQLRKGSAYLKELVAARLPIPVLTLSSEHDAVVYPTTAWSADGGRDASIRGVGHVALLFSQETFRMAAAFLDEADALRSPLGPPDLAYRGARVEPAGTLSAEPRPATSARSGGPR